MKQVRWVSVLLILFIAGCATGAKVKKDASYHYQMGVSYLQERNYTAALTELTESVRLTPDDPEVLFNLGLAYYYKNQYPAAEERFLRAVALRKEYSLARNYLGDTYLRMQRWDDAIAQFTIVSEDLFSTDQENAGMNLGLAYLGKGDTAKALSLLRPRVTANPRNPTAHLFLGRAYAADGKLKLAITEYREALRLVPDYAEVQYYLGQASLKAGLPEEARAAFGEVVRLSPYSELGRLSREQLDGLK
jgi:type IV pilus assembly protein PilF